MSRFFRTSRLVAPLACGLAVWTQPVLGCTWASGGPGTVVPTNSWPTPALWGATLMLVAGIVLACYLIRRRGWPGIPSIARLFGRRPATANRAFASRGCGAGLADAGCSTFGRDEFDLEQEDDFFDSAFSEDVRGEIRSAGSKRSRHLMTVDG